MAKKLKFPLKCIGIPKTVDNDLPYTDCSPGFGSVAKYIATSTLEAGLDVKSMAETSTKVFILEVMGQQLLIRREGRKSGNVATLIVTIGVVQLLLL